MKSGWLFVALYLKQASTCLMQYYYLSKPSKPNSLSVSISLTRSGIPRIIAPFHRKLIRRQDDRADVVVKIYLSAFTMAKLIKLAKPVSKETFQSILSPPSDLRKVAMASVEILNKVPLLFRKYIPDISTIPLKSGISWRPTWKAKDSNMRPIRLKDNPRKRYKSFFRAFPFEVNSWFCKVQEDAKKSAGSLFGILWYPRIRYCFDENNEMFSQRDASRFEREVMNNNPFPEFSNVTPSLGRLGRSIEGGGKRRIFAIGNWVHQRLLRPLNKWLMDVLRQLPMDGTFNQTAPLKRLVGSQTVYSVDQVEASSM